MDFCCYTCSKRPKCLVAKSSPHGRGVCTLAAGSKECKDTAASGWCRICRRWTREPEAKGGHSDRQTLFP